MIIATGHKKSGTPLLQFRYRGSRIARKSRTSNTKPTPYVAGVVRIYHTHIYIPVGHLCCFVDDLQLEFARFLYANYKASLKTPNM